MRGRFFYVAQLPLVMFVTAGVVVSPLLLLAGAQSVSGLRLHSVVTAVLASILSITIGWAGARLWLRNPRSKDVLFSDLMLWGWLQRLMQERRLAKARALQFDSSRRAGKSAQEQVAILKKLAVRLEAQDPYTHGHTRRVARHSYMIAKTMGLPRDFTKKVRTAAAVHDVGKMDIPIEVLHKPGRLSDDEFDLVKQHAVLGAEMVAQTKIDELTAMVRHHHERIDGRGYPDRLAGDDIPLGARIIAVADTFDALTSVRSYRDAAPHKKAIDILKKEAGQQLDPEATDAFLRYYNASRSRRFAAFVFSAPDKVYAWLSAALRQATTAAAVTSIAAATVAVAATPAVLPPRARSIDGTSKPAVSTPNTTSTPATSKDAASDTRSPKDGPRDKDGRPAGNGGSSGSGSNANADDSGSDGSGNQGSDTGDSGSGGDTGGSGSGGGGSGGSGPVDDVVDTVEDTVGDTVNNVGNTVDDTVDNVGDTVDNVGDTLDDATDIVNDKVVL